MAKVELPKIDEYVKELNKLGHVLDDESQAEILYAGAAVHAAAQKKAVMRDMLIDTGQMHDAIGSAKMKDTKQGGKMMEVYPRGKRKDGRRNETVAFVNHYGTSRLRSTRWMDHAIDIAETDADKAMEEKFENIIDRKTKL